MCFFTKLKKNKFVPQQRVLRRSKADAGLSRERQSYFCPWQQHRQQQKHQQLKQKQQQQQQERG